MPVTGANAALRPPNHSLATSPPLPPPRRCLHPPPLPPLPTVPLPPAPPCPLPPAPTSPSTLPDRPLAAAPPTSAPAPATMPPTRAASAATCARPSWWQPPSPPSRPPTPSHTASTSTAAPTRQAQRRWHRCCTGSVELPGDNCQLIPGTTPAALQPPPSATDAPASLLSRPAAPVCVLHTCCVVPPMCTAAGHHRGQHLPRRLERCGRHLRLCPGRRPGRGVSGRRRRLCLLSRQGWRCVPKQGSSAGPSELAAKNKNIKKAAALCQLPAPFSCPLARPAALPPPPRSDSQGFCCDCGSLINFGGDDGQLSRGNLDCGGFIQTQDSAHCLRFDNTWWHAVSAGSGCAGRGWGGAGRSGACRWAGAAGNKGWDARPAPAAGTQCCKLRRCPSLRALPRPALPCHVMSCRAMPRCHDLLPHPVPAHARPLPPSRAT